MRRTKYRGYVFKKQAIHPTEAGRSIGHAYTFVALERNSKLVLAWHLGRRSGISTYNFTSKLAAATTDHGFQLTTDEFKYYPKAVESVLSDNVDFATLVKVYALSREGEQRYSPPEVVDCILRPVFGNP